MPRYEYPSLRQGLVGAWCPSLGASGLSLIDRSGRGSHGTLVAPSIASWSASGSGVSLLLDGATQYATLPFSATFGSSATLSMWVRRTRQNQTSALDSGFFFANLDDGGQQSHYPYDSFIYMRLLRTNRVNGLVTLVDLTKWHNLCITTDGTNYTIYQAGQILSQTAAESTVKLSSPLVAGQSTFGIGASSATGFFAGALDDIRVYNRALTLAEIRLLASRRGIGLTPLPDRAAGLPRRFSVNVGGTWREADSYVNVGGDWKLGQPSVNVAGTWR